MKNFVEDNKFVLIATFLEGLPSKVSKKFSMLQSLVAPVITLAASIWIDSSWFLDSVEQLSHTELLYSIKGRT